MWANFTDSKDSMDKAASSFEKDVRDEMFPLFGNLQAVQRFQMFIIVGLSITAVQGLCRTLQKEIK